MIENWSLRIRVLLFFVLLGCGGAGLILGGLFIGFQRLGDADAASAFILAATVSVFGLLGLTAWIWLLFDENVAKPLISLAGQLRARAHADVEQDIDHTPAKYLGDLAPAASAVAANLVETKSALAEAVARETTRLAEEKERLATLLADVPVGVLLCASDHKIAFYNGTCQDLFGPASQPQLDRSVFESLRSGPLQDVYDRLSQSDAMDATDFMCATRDGTRVLAAHMRLVRGGADAAAGYVLTLRDVTADLGVHARRERLMDEMLDETRRRAANLQTIFAVADGAEPGSAIWDALVNESTELAAAVTTLGDRFDDEDVAWWPQTDIRGSDFADSLRAILEARGIQADVHGADLVLCCDGYALTALVAALVGRLRDALDVPRVTVFLERDGEGATIDITWIGDAPTVGEIEAWLAEPINDDPGAQSGRQVLDHHRSEAWPQLRNNGAQSIRIPLRSARAATDQPPALPRAAIYDFALLTKGRGSELTETPLSDLTFVVFDTETTGLLPSDGDEVVQIAALRIVNERVIETETFDTLVNPGRPIPVTSTAVHGITEGMVRDAPEFHDAARRFYRFAREAVLVAHNAPFDLAFFRKHEREIGVRFDNPVLDTVLLSAVVFGQSEVHTLDALCERLGVVIAEDDRHTAMGDTRATAEVFLKMLPMLRGNGIETFGDALTEIRRHSRLLEDAN